jgi:hypothetical protein
VTLYLSSVVSRQHRSLPLTRIFPAPLCPRESLYAAITGHLPSHRNQGLVGATLILSATAIPARRFPRDTRSPRPILRLGTTIPRHGTGAMIYRMVDRFVLAKAIPQCQLPSEVRSVVPKCLEQHVQRCGL